MKMDVDEEFRSLTAIEAIDVALEALRAAYAGARARFPTSSRVPASPSQKQQERLQQQERWHERAVRYVLAAETLRELRQTLVENKLPN
jgi:hypothetical protein